MPPTPADDDPPEGPYDRALSDLIDRLDAVLAEEHRTRDKLRRLRAQYSAHAAAIEKVVRLLPREQQRGWLVKAAWAERRHDDTREEAAARPDPTGRLGAIKHWIVESGFDHFTTMEVQNFLEREGYEALPGYVSKTCQRMARQGYLTRGSHGRYHVNHIHREFVDMALEMIGKKVKRFGVG
ncbi:hypothetical protein M1105_03535 [Limibaculum sp. FT325]|uniref:hypothetical protein n=1 Tax=Thermohalobaculum sediminis TaxID=2939436 RepID=UPI0020C06CB7|nr:hypothetical protein [Limibaculum sediminis]MCL5776072.1 hypothetical protein [Limibaculum sediminis]